MIDQTLSITDLNETSSPAKASSAEKTARAKLVESLRTRDLVFIDLEMSGGDCSKHDIIDIGAVRTTLPGLSVQGELSIKTQPRSLRGAQQEALRITGYNPRDWKNASEIGPALFRLKEFSQGSIAVGWSFHNDLLFLDAATERLGMEPFFPEGYIELQDWTQARFGNANKPNLHNQAHRLKIPHGGPHAGLADADVTCEIFRMLWRFGSAELAKELSRMDWNSYLALAGEIVLDEATISERIEELSAFVINERSKKSLLSRTVDASRRRNRNHNRKHRRY